MDSLTPTTTFEDISDTASENEVVITSRWWEAKAQKTLESTSSIADIQLICRYIPFSDPNAAILALSKQQRPQLNRLRKSAHLKSSKKSSSSQVAEAIVGSVLIGQETSTLPYSRPYWTPPDPASPTIAEEIAGSLDEHFCHLICYVYLRDLIAAALGYNTTAFTTLFEEYLDTYITLYQ